MLLLAVLFAAAGPAGAAAPASKAGMSRADAVAASERLSVLCARKPLAVDALLSDPAFRADSATFTGSEARELFDYAACRDLQGAPGICAALGGLGLEAGSTRCRTLAAENRFVFRTLAGGDALSACREHLALEGRRGPSVERGCAALIKAVRAGGPKPSCESLAGALVLAPEESCEDLQAMWSADPTVCDRYRDPDVKRECLGRAALVAGLRDPSRCPASPACRALVSKSPAACDGLRSGFSGALCARVAKDLAAEKARLAREPEQRRLAERRIQEELARRAAARSAAAAAEQAKIAEAAAKARAVADALREKLAKQAAAQAAKMTAAQAAVKRKAEAEARKAAAAKAKIERQIRPQFRKGAPMEATPPEAVEIIKALEEGRPLPPPRKSKPAPAPPADE